MDTLSTPLVPAPTLPVRGLTNQAVASSRVANGRNVLTAKSGSGLLATLKEVVTEPMFLLLLVACTVYFVLGRLEEAITLIVALLVPAARQLFGFAPVSGTALGWCALAALVGTGWVEVYKALRRPQQKT